MQKDCYSKEVRSSINAQWRMENQEKIKKLRDTDEFRAKNRDYMRNYRLLKKIEKELKAKLASKK